MNRPSQPSGLSDGAPMLGELIAVIDETVPEVGAGVHYVLTTAVTLSPTDVDLSLAQLFTDTPGRKRPFHWHKEGPAARNRITEIIIEHGVVAHSRYQTVGRRGQRDARQLLLADLSTELHLEGVDHLIIESVDDVTNGRDKRTLLDSFESSGGVPFAYDWRSKSERILWIADAINGAIHDYFVGGDITWFNQLTSGGVLDGEPRHLG
ncbi:MAG: hypothetical protein GY925_30530 [Actinomycetia bacterium]|nr:hypothetical protein [Actinomycetes bacterium]